MYIFNDSRLTAIFLARPLRSVKATLAGISHMGNSIGRSSTTGCALALRKRNTRRFQVDHWCWGSINSHCFHIGDKLINPIVGCFFSKPILRIPIEGGMTLITNMVIFQPAMLVFGKLHVFGSKSFGFGMSNP